MGKEAGYTLSFLESVLYGLISGLTEFIPVSSQGHQAIMLYLFGLSNREPVRDLWVHIGILLALLTACRPMFNSLRREQILLSNRRRKYNGDRRAAYELRLFKGAIVPLLIGLIFYFSTNKLESKIVLITVFFIVNGIIVVVPEYIRQGNKDGRFMSGMDSFLIGAFGALSVIPGISRVATINLYSMLRGVSRSNALNWALLMSVPALAVFLVFDIIHLFIIPLGTITFITILYYLVSAIAAYFGAYLGIHIMRYLSVHTGFAGFAYYSWGAAMFSFVLFLIA